MKHIWSVLCQKSSIDNESNLISLFDCLEEINVTIDKNKVSDPDKLVIPTEIQLISFWILEKKLEKDDALNIKVELLDPDQEVLDKFLNNFTVKKGTLRYRTRINLQGLKITKAGRYIIKLSQKNNDEKYNTVAELPIDLNIQYKIDLNQK